MKNIVSLKKVMRREIPNAKNKLRDFCFIEAKKIYGTLLPDMVRERLDLELSAIDTNGYASQYLIGQMIAEESLKKGYSVTTRGIIGSSFVAFLCHMTSVNPLLGHYICDSCHYFEPVKIKYPGSYATGYDLKDKVCPKCGSLLNSAGADIFPEILMGYSLNKEPDIALNVASEIRPALIDFLKESFGENSIFRAGIKVLHVDGSILRNVHLGGIFILPDGVDIAEITPLRDDFPDDDFHIPVTECDYHGLDSVLKKYDLLTIRELSILHTIETATGFNSRQIRMNDSDVLKVFMHEGFDYPTEKNNIAVTGIEDTVIKETQPHSFSDLVRISGLMRGTGTWKNNGEVLIKEGKTLHELITCRDDIMQYLINIGLERKRSYDIMNQIKKGKGLTDDMTYNMRNAGVPDWYIESCNKIKYLFPKSHVVEYMMIYWKLAYYRLHYPDKYKEAVSIR